MTPQVVTNYLLAMIVVLHFAKIIVFWYKATGLEAWFREGIQREAFWPTMIAAYSATVAFLGAFYVVGKFLCGKWTL